MTEEEIKEAEKKDLIAIVDNLKTNMLVVSGDLAVYSWSDDFKMMELRKRLEKCLDSVNKHLDGRLKTLDLTLEEIRVLGFGKWSEKSDNWLVPIWLYSYVNKDVKVKGISGGDYTMETIGNDQRFGFIAGGIKPREENE